MYASAQRRANSRNSVDFPMRRLPRQATNEEVRFRQSDSRSSSMSLRPTNIVVVKFDFSNLTTDYTIYAYLTAIAQIFTHPCREILFFKSHDTPPFEGLRISLREDDALIELAGPEFVVSPLQTIELHKRNQPMPVDGHRSLLVHNLSYMMTAFKSRFGICPTAISLSALWPTPQGRQLRS